MYIINNYILYTHTLHITGLYMYAAKAARLRSARSWLHHSHAMLHPQFGNPGLATQAIIRVAKPSYTTGTLCEIAY
jgi:hypothetical protein